MKKIIVVGGGISGLSSAAYLSAKAYQVELYEASPKLGGRAYSFIHKPSGDFIDNGQHLMMGAYKRTIEFFKLIGAHRNLEIIEPVKVCYVEEGGRQFELRAPNNIYPLNLLIALLRFSGLPVRKRFKLLKPFVSLIYPDAKRDITVLDWLMRNNQDDETIKSFWHSLVVSTLNSEPENVSALQFKHILREMFLKGASNSNIILPKYDLSNTYVHYARNYIEKNHGRVHLSSKVEKLVIEENSVERIILTDGEINDFSAVVVAVTPHALSKIVDEKYLPLEFASVKYSSILTVDLWLSNNPFTEKFYGLVDAKIHWLFNKGTYISLVRSSADELLALTKDELLDIVISELEGYFPLFYKGLVTDSHILFEKRATFIPSIKFTAERKKFKNELVNLSFAGDWVNTNLPSTIESAVESGYKAAGEIILRV